MVCQFLSKNKSDPEFLLSYVTLPSKKFVLSNALRFRATGYTKYITTRFDQCRRSKVDLLHIYFQRLQSAIGVKS